MKRANVKTHYSIDLSNSEAAEHKKDHLTPFGHLLAETGDHVRHRYLLYEKIWGHQKQAIETILNLANHSLFASLLEYIQDPVSERLDTAFLGLSSNTANNLRLLDEFSMYVAETPQGATHIRVVRLGSQLCGNIKAAVREMIKQIVEGPVSEKNGPVDEDENEQRADDNNSADDNSEFEDEGEDEDEESTAISGGRISYDFEIVQDWMDSYVKKHRCEDSLRIVVVLEDCDGFSTEVLNQLLQLVCVYTSRYPIKMVMALGTRNVGSWMDSNVTTKLRTLIEGVKFQAKENKDLGYQIIDEILLQNEITAQNPLLLDAYLSLVILSRFENSNNSIDSLITELKLAYIMYFYHTPLAGLVDPAFVPEKFHYDALRKLPSFKNHMEALVHDLGQNPSESEKTQVLRLLLSNKELKALFDMARGWIQKYQNAVMNAVNIVYWLCGGSKEKFQIYKLITNNQFMNSAFSSGVLKAVAAYATEEYDEFVSFLAGPLIHESVNGQIDEDVVRMKAGLQERNDGDLQSLLNKYFHDNEHLNMKISDNLFNEVLTINGGHTELDELRPAVAIEENYRNVMIDVIRPNTREVIETDLDEPQARLRNPLLMERFGKKRLGAKLVGPPLCKLYQVYKDTPVSINLWDFYVAFKLSLPRALIVAEIERHVQSSPETDRAGLALIMEGLKNEDNEDTWSKVVYAWFLQGCFELNAMGFLKEKLKGDYMEKLVWKNL
ncbi:hypothetical protein METBIDRAFT_78677 [Metschnikowia bicuspidata var. bicuspidata NRRL YB-4993]|uniref:Uncharacterized protein n=1 Tax=Metschnikowia bicuspidata var. bicuspidata NRRL YB-4993 TaxID=869754 RepID=A0A1A0H7Z7_9ASCO|nr:hypothetical protein METBIDRAFT_78677 [Metschnikowia bicuspidata var. bicuspidata NRRL YB-4993]OBA20224.1 hypothetical protein METBIDRAFT_78677 [Metschnikowia bicuspidata var. bicuspidata NRRL YB-4993]